MNTKCDRCGEQNPADIHTCTPKRPPNCGTGYCSCVECVMEPAPLAMAHIVGEIDHAGKVWAPAQPAPVQEPDAAALFREALAFGLAYGPELRRPQWDEMREEKVAQLVTRLATPPAQPELVRELKCVIGDLTAECKELRAAQPAPVPLTDEQITEGRRGAWNEVLDPFTAGVRFAEAAHGITAAAPEK